MNWQGFVIVLLAMALLCLAVKWLYGTAERRARKDLVQWTWKRDGSRNRRER